MPIVSILTFCATFIFIFLVGLYIFLTFYNKRTHLAINKFIKQTSDLKPTVFQNIKLRYSETSGLKISFYPNNHCDLYLFNNNLAIVRRQNFFFKVFFAPIILTSDISSTKNTFNYLETYTPDQIKLKQIVKEELDITLTNPKFNHYSIEITLKKLTIEQINEISKLINWS